MKIKLLLIVFFLIIINSIEAQFSRIFNVQCHELLMIGSNGNPIDKTSNVSYVSLSESLMDPQRKTLMIFFNNGTEPLIYSYTVLASRSNVGIHDYTGTVRQYDSETFRVIENNLDGIIFVASESLSVYAITKNQIAVLSITLRFL